MSEYLKEYKQIKRPIKGFLSKEQAKKLIEEESRRRKIIVEFEKAFLFSKKSNKIRG